MGDQNSWSTPSSYSPSNFLFLNNLKQPENHTFEEFELHENDVVWSSDDTTTLDPISHSPPTPRPRQLLRHHHQLFNPSISGISAALSDDNIHPLIHRKSTLNPSRSATKLIPNLKSPTQSNFHQSAPINVPLWPNKIGSINKNDNNYLDKFDEVDDEVDGDDEMVPPHVIIARSHVTYSVFEVVGRTLKGRDLRRVRNAVFQKTGFID